MPVPKGAKDAAGNVSKEEIDEFLLILRKAVEINSQAKI